MAKTKRSDWLRRKHVREWLGIDDAEMTKLVSVGVIKPRWFLGEGYAYYERAKIEEALTEGKIFKSTKNQTSSP